jgi:hypothetical protein
LDEAAASVANKAYLVERAVATIEETEAVEVFS